MDKNFFPDRPDSNPTIYAYEDTNPQYKALLKVGFTNMDVQKRVAQQYPTLRPGELPYKIVLEESAMRRDGSTFNDHEVHRLLRKRGIPNPDGEWFRCTTEDVQSCILAIKEGREYEYERVHNFSMRPEQLEAVNKTMHYFKNFEKENPNKTPHFLWNAKMRFGKTFTAYQLAKSMGWKRVLVLTFKPAVESSWEEDLMTHADFEGWQFVSRNGLSIDDIDTDRPFVCFGSFQDYLGKNSAGGIKTKNEWVHATPWDCIIFDEYHFGAWREKAQDLFGAESKKEQSYGLGGGRDYYNEDFMPITTDAYLYLSGTPFRAINSGEFIEEEIYNWTYSDEQRAKENWTGSDNPYALLPRMVLLTYQLPDDIRDITGGGEFDEFDLNAFFEAEGRGEEAEFTNVEHVQKWLNLIRGAYMPKSRDNLKLGSEKPPMPFSDRRLLGILSHTFWFLPSVASCYAMRNLMMERQNSFYHNYNINICAGPKAGIGLDALPPVLESMEYPDPLESKTITLSCGKLTTGVTVKPWTGIFMLRNSSSPETYFQAAFRVQNPWVIRNADGTSPNQEEIIKKECYVFDFAPNRALSQIATYSCQLDVSESNPEKKVAEFINFLPILAYDGSSMKQIDAAGVLDMALSGTTSTLLAKRWESALLVNVDNPTLQRLMESEKAMDALMSIEGFRTLNQDLETIINKAESIKKTKKKANEEDLTKNEKKKLSKEEKEYKSLRKEIQEKLIKFGTRIPIFMYLTDYRERSLKDVITQLEPGLFRKATGLTVKDFELLISLGVFNAELMNDAIYKFKRYEDASLEYTGINKRQKEKVGLYDTVLSSEDYEQNFVNESV
jgi:hypothetical protein